MSPVPLASVVSPSPPARRPVGSRIPAAEVAVMRGVIYGLLCSLVLWGLFAALLIVVL